MDMEYDYGYRTSKVGERGQVTIPQELRRRYGIRPGEEVRFEEHADGLILRRQVTEEPLRALVGRIRERIDVDEYLEETRGPAPDDGPDE
jgi:AbrB family looped-hinge helix DNA binding protein